MKPFIFSYLASVTAIILIFFPAVKDAPLEVIPRVGFYFGFPAAVLLSVVWIALSHAMLSFKKEHDFKNISLKSEGQHQPLSEQKVA